ncbi:MAG: endonuclease/exonuclease/phosphatase family protein [Paramuribaculum sp.]|nr:endonuclease/exonuclease/phosphatase family protein [Paramuribaculum sp.]
MKRILKICTIVISVITASALILCAYGGCVNPLRSVLPALMNLMFPAIAIFSLLLLVTFAFFARKTAIILAAAFVICSPPLFNLCPVNLFRSVPDGENSFTVMTYNVCNLTDFTNPTSDCTTNPTLAAILSERPDIAALQECQTFEHSRSAEVNTDMLDSLYNIYPYRTNGAEGQALLSKFPFEELKLHFNTTHIFQVRAYRINAHTDTFTLFNLHLKSIGLTDSDKELYKDLTKGKTETSSIRAELSDIKHDLLSKLATAFRERAVQAQRVKELVDSIGGNVIVCGDFNDAPGCYAIREIKSAGLDDAYRHSATGPCITYHADRFYFRIDHILYRGFTPAKTICPKIPYSDHYPLITTFVHKN